MQDINYLFEDNIGGGLLLEFIPSADVVSIPEIDNNYQITTPAILQPGKQWYKVYGTHGTLGYTETEELTDHGPVYKKTASVFVPKDRATNAKLMDEMENESFILRLTDANGFKRIVGSLEEPMQFKADASTQQAFEARNGTQLMFFGDNTFKSPFYTA